ncbi:S1 motif domain-containing protein [Chloropicon roscoffensis]|uniref:S1 motif domain-containing protein n=1 Tax=Chloropicon roscoffensis TaxID=1461544 RepID=A0AAX4PBD1_9CHLO
MEARMTGGARVRGARRSRAPAAGGTRQLGTRRLVLSSQEARFRPWRPTAPRSVQVWSSLSSGDLEKPERPAPTSFEREAPEPIPEISLDDLDDASRSPAPVADEDQYGSTVYDKDPEAVAKDLDIARECMHQEKKVPVSILRLNKAGVVCKFSDVLEAFVPVAQLSSYTRQFYREEWVGFGNEATVARDQTRRRGSKSLVGENIDACVIGVRDQQDEGFGQKHMVVMSEKKAEELGASEIFDVTERGDVVECYVKTVTHFGIFVKLGAIDALIHKSQVWLPEMEEQGEDIMIDESMLSSNFKLGDRLQAVVIKADREKGQISLSMKALVPNRSKLSLSEIAQEMKNITTQNQAWAIPEMITLCSTLDEMDAIEEIIPGPCIKSGAVAPDFQVLLSSAELEGGYEVFARKGFQVQEARVKTQLGRQELKALLQEVSSTAA